MKETLIALICIIVGWVWAIDSFANSIIKLCDRDGYYQLSKANIICTVNHQKE